MPSIAPPAAPRILATFHPQAWVNDYACPVDPEGETTFDVTDHILALSPDGGVLRLKWIEGGKGGVELDAPTGSAIESGVLYVADLASVRMFDAETGAPRGAITIEGATLLNDMAAAPDGRIYVSDSGFDIGAAGELVPTGTDAIYVLEHGSGAHQSFALGNQVLLYHVEQIEIGGAGP